MALFLETNLLVFTLVKIETTAMYNLLQEKITNIRCFVGLKILWNWGIIFYLKLSIQKWEISPMTFHKRREVK